MFAAINSFLTRLGTITDPYWAFVSMLLHGDSPQQFNQDTSTNVFPISDSAVPNYSVASMQASTRTPFTGGPSSNGSGFFNGTNAGLTTPANTAFVTGTTSTIEMWVYPTVTTIQRLTNNGTGGGLDVFIYTGGVIYVNGANGGTTTALTLNVWTHLAVVYNSGTLTIYFNGVSQALTGTTTGYNFTANGTVYIGNSAGTAQFFSGYLSNVRVVKGVAVYTGNFTPPTASLAATQSSGTNISAITGTQTSLLTLQTNVPQNNNQFFDTSTNNFTVTRNGNTTQGSFNPFVSTYPYSVATNGGSAYFDGTGDSLTVPDNAAFTLGTNDFTIECWINFSSLASQPIFTAQMNAAATVWSYYMVVLSTGQLNSVILDSSSATQYTASSAAGAILVNTWYHVAFVRNGNTNRQYINGVQAGTVSVTGITVRDSVDVLGVGKGGAYAAGQLVTGYISNFRLVNGTCLYPSGTTFTPPTAPLTAVTNTALLLGMSNGAIFDNTMLNNLETVGDAQISTSVFKYGTGSLKFDGTGDYLTTPNKALFSFGTGDFTIEMWVYTSNLAANQTLLDTRIADTASAYGFFVNNTGKPYWYDASGIQVSSTALTSNTWTHVAAVRTSGVLKIFQAGIQVYSAANTNVQTPLGSFVVGRNIANTVYFNGYIDDLRVTKGIARYTTTFTPPTAAFPNSGDGVQIQDYVVVGGGAGGGVTPSGGRQGGGGGAGGYQTGSAVVLFTGTTYTITVGGGGAIGVNGGSSSFSSLTPATVTSTGGGAGGTGCLNVGVAGTNGVAGASGGGGGSNAFIAGGITTSPGAGTVGQGNNGGSGGTDVDAGYGGGGGGAGGVGVSGGTSGAGGAGLVYVGTGTTYSAGGSGAGGGASAANIGKGGNTNTAGGSGVVIFRVFSNAATAVTTTGSPTITTVGLYRIYTYTASGTIKF